MNRTDRHGVDPSLCHSGYHARNMAHQWVLEYPSPSPPWSTNEERRRHWAWVARQKDAWNEAAYWHAKAAGLTDLPPGQVTVTIPFATRRRRDPHNYVGTVVKASIDGLVAAGVWPDDTPEWVRVNEPRLVIAPAKVTITVTAL